MSSNANGRDITVKGIELGIDMLVDGIATVIPGNATVNLDGKTMSQADALKAAQAIQAVYKARRDLRNALAAKNLEIVTATNDEARRFLNAAFHMAAATLGAQNHDLRKLGFKPKRPPTKLSAEEAARRAEKSRRTREARHTLGPRQKAQIHGAAPDASPAPAPATPAPSPADTNRRAV